MSTNKTTNYQLHVWEANDKFLRTEVNENFNILDITVKAERTGSDLLLGALENVVNAKAEVVFGTYTGTGSAFTIELGFTPKLVISGQRGTLDCGYGGIAAPGLPCAEIHGVTVLSICEGGFQVPQPETWMYSNQNGTTYYYLAFR